MSDSEGEVEVEVLPTKEELMKWKKPDLQEWLSVRGEKKTGNKSVLVGRILRLIETGKDSDDVSDEECANTATATAPDFNSVQNWEKLQTTHIPGIREQDIENYFIYRKHPLGNRKINCQRQFTKSKKFSAEQYLFDIAFSGINSESDYCYFKSKCKPSMKGAVLVGPAGQCANNYSLWVRVVKKTGQVDAAYCDCKAGDSGVCSHVGGLLHYLVKVSNPCTGATCSWDRPRDIAVKPAPARICDINMSANMSQPLKPYPGIFQAGPCSDPDIFLADLLKCLGDVNPSCVLYQTLCAEKTGFHEFLDQFKPDINYADWVDMASAVSVDRFETFVEKLVITKDQADVINEATRGQALNAQWVQARTLLITSSNFGTVIKRKENTAPDNLVRRLRGYTSMPNTKPIKHGRNNEENARIAYARLHRKNCHDSDLKVEEAGLRVSSSAPFLGTSVDGVVSCKKCGNGVLEIKCPYGSNTDMWRNMTPEQCCRTTSKFFCSIEGHDVKLNRTHQYFYQVQGQLEISDVEWCDFVVWTRKGVSVERINRDKELWANSMQPKLKAFYLKGIVPELFTGRLMRGKSLYE